MPNLLATLGARIKAASTALVYPGGFYGPAQVPGQPFPGFIPADANGGIINLGLPDADGATHGPAWTNSAVSIGLDWIARNFTQADLVVERRAADEWGRVPDHPLVALLDDPIPDHPTFDFFALWAATGLSCLVQGNGYWYKGRDRTGAVRELWPLNHEWVTPYRPNPSAPDFLYRYRVPVAGRPDYVEDFDPADVVHFRWGQPDPRNDLLSVAPLARCLLERMADTEAARYRSALLANRGVPGLVVVYEDLAEAPANGREADEVKGTLDHRFGGRNRFSTAILKGKVRLESHAFDPGKMDLGSLGHAAEARLSGALGVHPMVLGLSVGDSQRTYNNYKEADAQSWANGIRPLQGRMAEALYRQLLPDFEADRRDLRVAWDYSRVEALQEDRDARAKRAVLVFQGGLIHKNEARAEIGKPPVEGGDDVWWTSQNPNEGATLAAPAAGSPPLRIAKGMTHDGRKDSVAQASAADPGDMGADVLGRLERDGRKQGGPIDPARPIPGMATLDGPPEDPDVLAVRVLKRLEARLDADGIDGDRGGLAPPDPGAPGAVPPQDGGGESRPAPGQSAWAPEWEADRQPDAADVPGDGDGGAGLAGGAIPQDDPGESPEPGPPRPGPGGGPGEADLALPPGGGGADAGGPGPGDDLGAESPGQ